VATAHPDRLAPTAFRADIPGMQATPPRRIVSYLWREWIRPLAIPLLLIAAAKSALADLNPVPTGSMIPTVLEGDVVFVNKLAYDLKVPFTTLRLARWADPARGDIVVCFAPDDGTRLLKRVVGLPGDTIELRNDRLLINDQPLRYDALERDTVGFHYLDEKTRLAAWFAREQLEGRPHPVMIQPRRPALRNFGPLTIPAGSYFMLGDNRDDSRDSRFFGLVPREQIVGEAKAVFVSGDLANWVRPRFGRFCTALN
jgi:signal peptidase I